MKLSKFDFKLPKSLIASKPISPRDASRLLLVNRKTKKISHHKFNEFPEIINQNYTLIFNKTRVIPAKFFVIFDNKSKGELLLLKEKKKNVWEILCKPAKKFKHNSEFKIFGKNENNFISGFVSKTYEDGTREITFNYQKNIFSWIEANGLTPLPPYIKNSPAKFSQYQTIYAKENGSVAAPTAGLHFTKRIFNRLETNNIKHDYVTLHVGRGTFEPVKTENIIDHEMHKEWYEVTKKCAVFLNKSKKNHNKILAIGTTSARTLESNVKNGKFHSEQKETNLFIYPGYKFKAIDALLTNFHLPKSTLLMLISAFAGKDLIFKAYEEAIQKKYRFFSFGDAMLII